MSTSFTQDACYSFDDGRSVEDGLGSRSTTPVSAVPPALQDGQHEARVAQRSTAPGPDDDARPATSPAHMPECEVCGRPVHKPDDRYCASCRVSGKRNPRWNGGRKHKDGYVLLRRPFHPRGPYVGEHILVMEAALGRRLHKGETVHHKNGVRDDNRFQNLELWTRPQPAGARAADAVAWALDILRDYGHLVEAQANRSDMKYRTCNLCDWEALGAPLDVDRSYEQHMNASHPAPKPAK